jgi:predicted RNA-binding Zn-ribbon protein involved in translation (DUF1610 family)
LDAAGLWAVMSIFRRSDEELDRLRAAVRMLGSTTVPGLSLALGCRDHRTEKLLARELARPDTPLVYEPSRRMVRVLAPPPEPAPAPPSATLPPLPALAPRSRGASIGLKGTTLKSLCPSCHQPLLATGSGSLSVCPQCGRLAAAKAANESPPAPAAPEATPTPGVGYGGSRPPTAQTDRRSQELFAAYVTSRPIPCPNCRTPLRHRGVSEYGCPRCGQLVRFPQSGGPGAVVMAPPLPAA